MCRYCEHLRQQGGRFAGPAQRAVRDQAKVRHQRLQRPAHLTQQADAGRTQRTVGIRQAGLGGGVA